MIKLDVQPYCHNCQVFEADVVNAYKTINDDGEWDLTDTVIRCRRRNLCSGIKKYLEREMKKEENTNG